MRIDPKYFNLFIAFCAFVTIIVIIYGTINYSRNQASDFRDRMNSVRLDTLSFKSYSEADSLYINEYEGSPVVIQFWSTWSGKSLEVNNHLEAARKENFRLVVIAAAVRDGEEKIMEYIHSNDHNFQFVEGTELFQDLLVPGIPSQIFINENGELSSVQVGDDQREFSRKLDILLHE